MKNPYGNLLVYNLVESMMFIFLKKKQQKCSAWKMVIPEDKSY